MGLFRKSRPPEEEEEERDLGAIAWLQPNGLIKLLIFSFILYIFVGPYFSTDSPRQVMPGDGGADKHSQGEELSLIRPVDVSELDEVSIFGYRVVDKIRALGVISKDLKEGTGQPVACGQEVEITYRVFAENGKAIFPAKAMREETILLGKPTVPEFLADGVTGMKAGGERRVFFAPEKNRDAEGKPLIAEEVLRDAGRRLTAEIHLKKLHDSLPDSAMQLRVFSRVKGRGAALGCGDTAKIQYTAWGEKGEKLGQGSLEVQTGKNTLPLGLELGAVGLRPGGTRTLVMPPEFLQPRHESIEGEKLRALLAPGKLVVLDISREADPTLPAPTQH